MPIGALQCPWCQYYFCVHEFMTMHASMLDHFSHDHGGCIFMLPVHVMFMSCSCLVHVMLMSWSCHLHVMFMSCACFFSCMAGHGMHVFHIVVTFLARSHARY